MNRFPAKAHLVLATVALSCFLGCAQPPHPQAVGSPAVAATTRDLAVDERFGGHTLKRHVGRSDAELRDRLQRDSHIHAASTYSDRAVAETAVGKVLRDQSSEVQRWLGSDRRTNLALDEDLGSPVGRTLGRGQIRAADCSRVAIILKRIARDAFYVLTSYPQCAMSSSNE